MTYSTEKLLNILKRGFTESEWAVLRGHSFLAAKIRRVETLDELEDVTRLGSDYLEDMARAGKACWPSLKGADLWEQRTHREEEGVSVGQAEGLAKRSPILPSLLVGNISPSWSERGTWHCTQ